MKAGKPGIASISEKIAPDGTVTRTIRLGVTTEGSAKASQNITAVATSLHTMRSAFLGYLQMQIRLKQATISLTRATWDQALAQRELGRIATYNFKLDVRRAVVQAKLAQRQLLITQRTGRQLDVQMGLLDVESAVRDVAIARINAFEKENKIKKDAIIADMQLELINQQINLMYVQMAVNIGVVTGLIIAQTAAIWAQVAAQTALNVAKSAGMMAVGGAALGIGGAVAGGVASYYLMKHMFPTPKAVPEPMTQAQTQAGDIKLVQRSGVARVDRGEVIGQPGTMGGGVNVTVHIYGSEGKEAQNDIGRIVTNEIERYLLQKQTIFAKRPRGTI